MSSNPGDPTLPSASDAGATIEMHAEEYYCSACNQSYPSSETKTCPKDGARLIKLAAQVDTLIGKVLDDRYEIRAPLGKGGMGTVYRGWQLSVDREVAIKVIHPKLSDDRSAVKRFLREARLASRLSQPNIVNVYDFGQSEGVLFLVMELLRGHTLSTELGQGRRINPKRTTTMALQLCDALEAAHAQGIIHRDLKPGNIVILDDPPGRDLIKVLDFGLAKSLVQDSGSIVTNTDALLGTPLYMSPEQIEGKVSDQRADLYSLGCILYEMLSGKPPFIDTAVSAVLARHMGDAHVPLPSHVPTRLRTLVDSLLAKKPEDRIQTAGEIRRELDDIRDGGMRPTPQPNESLPGVSDTIPDVEDALAETHAATPVPASSVISNVGVPAVSAFVSTPSVDEARPGGSQPKRYALIAVFMLVPLAVMVVVLTKNKADAPNGAAGSGNAIKNEDNKGVADDAATTPMLARPPPATELDAGVANAVTMDAGAGKKPTGSTTGTRPRPTGTTGTTTGTQTTAAQGSAAQTPAGTQTQPKRVDAGVDMPDIDFVKPKKPEIDFVKPKQ